MDIFSLMTERYNVPIEKLVTAYITGAMHALKERRKQES